MHTWYCVYMCVHGTVCVNGTMWVCVYTGLYVCVHGTIYACVHGAVCIYVYMGLCVYMCAHRLWSSQLSHWAREALVIFIAIFGVVDFGYIFLIITFIIHNIFVQF